MATRIERLGYADLGADLSTLAGLVPTDLVASTRALLARNGVNPAALLDSGSLDPSALSPEAAQKVQALLPQVQGLVQAWSNSQANLARAQQAAKGRRAAAGTDSTISEADAINAALYAAGLVNKYVVGQPPPFVPQDSNDPINQANNWLTQRRPDGMTNADWLADKEMKLATAVATASVVGTAIAPLIPVYFTGMKTLENVAIKFAGQGAARIVRAMTIAGVPGGLVQVGRESIAEYGIGGTIILAQAALWAATVPFVGWVIGGALAAGYLVAHALFGGESDEEKRQKALSAMADEARDVYCFVNKEACEPATVRMPYGQTVTVPPGPGTWNGVPKGGMSREDLIGWYEQLKADYCKENPGGCTTITFPGTSAVVRVIRGGENTIAAWAHAKKQRMLKDILDKFVAASREYQAAIDSMKDAAIARIAKSLEEQDAITKALTAKASSTSTLLWLGGAGALGLGIALGRRKRKKR